MKNTTLILASFLFTNIAWGLNDGFNFSECSGSGSFEQEIQYYAGDYENAITVGTIPSGIEGLHIELSSDKDVDIRLYSGNNDKIVHWPYGILSKWDKETALYQNVPITYSGYNGVSGQKGHEYINVSGTTKVPMTMKAFGYRAGYATVNYSWTGKDNCTYEDSGTGSFTQEILNKATNLVGTIPPHINNVKIKLTSNKDLDIQLYGIDGTAIVSWNPTGLISDATKQSVHYHDMNITWSGYNGTNGNKGDEYITISGITSEMLVMKVYGYEAGSAQVEYSWGDNNTTKNWRDEYLDNARQELRAQYNSKYNETIPSDTYAWIVSHGFENSLLQATEVDPRIVKNVHEILAGLTEEVSEEYANMIFGIAMARRQYGVDTIHIAANRYSRFFIPTPPTDKDIQKENIQKEYAQMTQTFMTQNGWDVNQSVDHLDEILAYLNANGEHPKFSKDVTDAATYIQMIKKNNGLIKPRNSYASVIDYINFIAQIQKETIPPFVAKDKSALDSANIFPHDAPWPLLMPLAESRPLDEMEWIWNRFKDNTVDASKRYRLYGNYRKPAESIAPYMARATHAKGSVEYINYVGGVCGTMSQIGRATLISLGVPSMGTGQPKHACITRYTTSKDHKYLTRLDQAITTLYNSTPDWSFFEDDSFRMLAPEVSYGEYQMGLSLAMNSPLQEYLDSRTLVRMAKSKTGDEKKVLLKQAMDASIYNAEAIYDRFDAMGRDFNTTKTLVDELLSKLPVVADGYTETKAPEEDLLGEDVNASLDAAIVKYRDTVVGALLSEFFKDSYNNNTPLPEEYTSWIKEINSKNFHDLMHYYSFEAFNFRKQNLNVKKYFKYLDADREWNKEFKRQKDNADLNAKIAEKEQSIEEKEAEYADINTSNARKKALLNQIDRLTTQINNLKVDIEANDVKSAVYTSYIYGDGLS